MTEIQEDFFETNENEQYEPSPVKGVSIDHYILAKHVIVSGFKNNIDENAIKAEMFKQGVQFSDIVKLFRTITISEGLKIDPKKVKAEIDEVIEDNLDIANNTTNKDITYEMFEPIIALVKEEVEGVTNSMIIGRLKAFLAEYDLELPKPPKKRKQTFDQKMKQSIVNFFKKSDVATKENYDAMIEEVCNGKSEKIIEKWKKEFDFYENLIQAVMYYSLNE